MLRTPLKILHVSFSDSGGGAARAAYRLHQSLVGIGVDSQMLVCSKRRDDFRVFTPYDGWKKLLPSIRARVGSKLARLEKPGNPILHSLNILPSGLHKLINTSNADIVNLHWINNEMLSIREIGKIRKPVVWTLHDSWPFCATEHHPDFRGDQSFITGYQNSSSVNLSHLDLSNLIWKRKLRNFPSSFTIVGPSSWITQNAKRSRIFGENECIHIFNPINSSLFRPLPKNLCRQLLGLPLDRKIILFGAIGGTKDPIKGWDLLSKAFSIIAQTDKEALAAVLGQSQPKNPINLDLDVRFLGHVTDDTSLALAYNAADVTVVPSRIDNLPQMASESLTCGTPVVGFRVGGIPDLVQENLNGFLANPFDCEELAALISRAIRGHGLQDRDRIHTIAALSWGNERVAQMYFDRVYRKILKN